MEDINVMDDPEGGCIVQAEDPQMLAAFDGAGPSGTNSWYWTSMLKLNMDQGSAPSSMSSTHNNININNLCTTGAHFTHDNGQQQATDQTPPPSTSSPSSSSVHDQPIDMLAQNNAFNASDPESSVWGQEFLSGPIGETKMSNILNEHQQLDDGLHELLYPRTVLELLFSDQLKLEQMPSWPDILQHTVSAGGPGKTLGFPLASDKISIMGGPAHDINVINMDNPQLDIKFPPQYLHNYAHFSGLDDRLSSSTASSTLSDNTAIDQWAPTGSSAAQCENAQAHSTAVVMHSSPLSNMQQLVDHTRVKQEYDHVPSPQFGSNENTNNFSSHYMQNRQPQNQRMLATILHAAGNGSFDEALMQNHDYEQKPSLIRKLWNPAVLNANDPLTHINHKHHIYESITAANFSHNLRQVAGLNGNGYNLQSVSTNGAGVDHAQMIIPSPGAVSALQNYITHEPSQQLAKKSRPFHEYGSGAASTSTAHEVVEPARIKDEVRDHEESKTSSAMALHMSNCTKQQQLSGTEYNFKRSRIEQPRGHSPPSSSTSTPTTPATNSSASFKSQPVRKEKLSERITTLQQLVSPFGKTDTASVLLEAIGYIKFLQEQVQALSSPYFKSPTTQRVENNHNTDEGKPDLRSRGLCLVPLSCTMQVANDNGADYWYGGAFR